MSFFAWSDLAFQRLVACKHSEAVSLESLSHGHQERGLSEVVVETGLIDTRHDGNVVGATADSAVDDLVVERSRNVHVRTTRSADNPVGLVAGIVLGLGPGVVALVVRRDVRGAVFRGIGALLNLQKGCGRLVVVSMSRQVVLAGKLLTAEDFGIGQVNRVLLVTVGGTLEPRGLVTVSRVVSLFPGVHGAVSAVTPQVGDLGSGLHVVDSVNFDGRSRGEEKGDGKSHIELL